MTGPEAARLPAAAGRRFPAVPRPSSTALLAAFVVVGAVPRLAGLGSVSLWLDEASSWSFARHSIAQIWSWSPPLDNANPPLYYTLLHVWMALGDSPFDLRLLSVVASLAVIPVTFALGKVIGGPRLGLVAALLATVSPFAVEYAQEARAYALLLLAAAAAMWALATLLAQPGAARRPLGSGLRDLARRVTSGGSPPRARSLDAVWLVYILAVACALLLHDTAFLLLVAANAAFLAWLLASRSRDVAFVRNWCLAQAMVVLLWLPWLPGFLAQARAVQAAFWIPFPTVERIMGAAYELLAAQTFITPPTGARWIVAGVIAVGIAGLALAGLATFRRTPRWVGFLVVFLALAPAAEVALSIVRPLLLARTLIWTTVPLELAVAAGILAVRGRGVQIMALGLVLLVSGWGVWNYLTIPRKEAWDQAAAYVAAHAISGDGVLFATAATQVPFDYYFRTAGRALDEHGLPRDMPADHYVEEPMTPADTAGVTALASAYARVWLVSSVHADFTDPAGLVPISLARTDALVASVSFTGDVQLYLYVRQGTTGSRRPPRR